MKENLKTMIKEIQEKVKKKGFVLVCIGTDNHTWDSIGPITGSMLKKEKPEWIIYGDLNNPVTALNSNKIRDEVIKKHKGKVIIAIDLAIGEEEDDDKVFVRRKSVYPGSGLGKTLKPIGDYSIVYSVNEKEILENKRIRKPYSGAERIVNFLKKVLD